MLRTSTGTVKARVPTIAIALGLAAATLLSGCYWRRYPKLVETHLTVLLEFAAKLQALADDRETVPAERWGEFTYPLERARDFSRIAARRFADRRSLASFDRTVEAYADLVADPRILERSDAAAEVARRVVELRTLADQTRADLARETS
ncbi:MAG TPA: hypothetical protein VFD92_15445 [Candidatus Binatia bacterium]|nr:hypothetical protein [Candidatus Binatia bacterium]